jgi:hypothetical protein
MSLNVSPPVQETTKKRTTHAIKWLKLRSYQSRPQRIQLSQNVKAALDILFCSKTTKACNTTIILE